MTAILTLGEMVNLALGTPEVGCVNYNALHTLLHGILAKLQISDAPVQLGQLIARPHKSPDHLSAMESEEWGAWIGSQPSLTDNKDDEGKKEGGSGMEKENFGAGKQGGSAEADKAVGSGAEKAIDVDKGVGGGGKDKGAGGGKDKGTGGGADKGAAGKSSPGEKGKKEGRKSTGGEASRGRKASSGRASVGSPGATDSAPLMVNSMPYHELAKKVEKLEESWKDLNELQKIDPFRTDEKGVPLHDMWETLQFQKRLDANTEGVDRLMALVQEILHRIQRLAENDAEQMALITGSHQRLESLAPKTDFDAMRQELSSIADRVDNLQDKDGLVTWDVLESALKGTDTLQDKGQERDDGEKVSYGSMNSEESELALIGKDEEDDAEGGAGRKDGASGKSGKDKRRHGSGKEAGSPEHPYGKGQESGTKDGGSAKESGRAGEMESGKRDEGGITGSGGQLDDKEGGWDEAGSRRSSGGGKARPSSDLQTVLGVLGRLDDKFKALLDKVSGIENNLPPKDIGLFKITGETVKTMSDSALIIESTREQLKDFSDELSRSYLDPLKNANAIIATLRDTADCQLPPTHKEEEQKLTGRRAEAIGALEKSMILVDKTFGVLQRAVQNLDCKLTNQTIKWDEKLSSFPDSGSRPGTGSRNLISSPSMEDEACKDEEPEVASQSAVDSQTRLKELEKKLGLRKDEMCKMTKRLNQLNRAISQQLQEAKDRLNDLESRLSDMTCDLKRLIQKIESERGEYVVPTAAVLDGSGVSLLIGVQKALDELKTDMEKLSGKTDSLQQNNSKHQDSIEDLLKYASALEEKKTDKSDLIAKATKQDLDLKLDSRVFESTCDEMTKNVNSLLGRVSRLDEECKNSFDKLTSDLGGCMTSEEFDRIRDCMAKQFKVLARKLAKMQKQLEIAKLVGDDAAGIRRQLFKCLSCDRTILMASQDPKPALPSRDGLFPYRSTKPYTTYELEQIRQHARCFQIPKGLSNYERAVIERQLSRFKLRDLRGNANPYWKQDHPSSTVKHIRTAAVSPNSQGDAAVTGTTDDPSPFPDPYACTRPCGGSHTLTSPYKRVIHMADLNSIITTDEQNTYQQNQENNLTSPSPLMSNEKSIGVNVEEAEKEDHQTDSASQVSLTSSALLDDPVHVEPRPKSGTENLVESQSNPQPPPNAVAANSVIKQSSDDSGRRFSDPTMPGGVGKKPDLKKANAKSSGDRRISAPNASSSAGSTPNSSTYLKKRRFSTPVTVSTRETSSPSAHHKKAIKEPEMKEEDANNEEEEKETTNNTNKDNTNNKQH